MNTFVGGLLLCAGALVIVAGVKSRGSQLFASVSGVTPPTKGSAGKSGSSGGSVLGGALGGAVGGIFA